MGDIGGSAGAQRGTSEFHEYLLVAEAGRGTGVRTDDPAPSVAALDQGSDTPARNTGSTVSDERRSRTMLSSSAGITRDVIDPCSTGCLARIGMPGAVHAHNSQSAVGAAGPFEQDSLGVVDIDHVVRRRPCRTQEHDCGSGFVGDGFG
ncbi:hypothetical protein BJF84_25330 [Rhodococcus sp. CUA-806]|nr:hypothetical protein BJF84_25330 [Rhodococcus sp. CUA-806]